MLPILATVGSFGLAPLDGTAQADDGSNRLSTYEAAALMPTAELAELALPQVLSAKDSNTYRQIFAAQELGNWKAANRLIAKLVNPLLSGHVKAQRYLHPTKYRSRYKELKAWMDKYADHPDAQRTTDQQ